MLDDDTTCHRHADRTAAVACQRCERPICTECMHSASVGFHCPTCTRTGAQKVVRASDLRSSSSTPATLALIIINVGAFLLQGSGLAIGDPAQTITRIGELGGSEVADGEYWRIITSAFLHRSLLHLGFNMFFLWTVGQLLERALGTPRFLLTYAAGLLGGSVAVLAFSFDALVAGASGAVLGLAGALGALLWARGIPLTQTSVFGLLVINLALPLIVPRISFWGHLGGIAGGFVAGWLLSWLPEKFGRPMNVAVGATLGWCLVLAAAALAIPTVVGG
ncbi:MAG: rhomboid family intramembrane serine protease [Actinomycetota bacterium]